MALEEKIAEELIDFAKSFENGDTLDTAEYVQRITSAVASLCVGVKELEWETCSSKRSAAPGPLSFDGECAITPFALDYAVSPAADGGGYEAGMIGEEPVWEAGTLDAAKTLCQSDFTSRISSCLNIRTEEEVRREYLEELIGIFGGLSSAVDHSSENGRALGASCASTAQHLRSLQQEGKGDA